MKVNFNLAKTKIWRQCSKGCEGGTIHAFPKDVERRNKWLELLELHDDGRKQFYACSAHFSNMQYVTKKLAKNAVPDVNLSKICFDISNIGREEEVFTSILTENEISIEETNFVSSYEDPLLEHVLLDHNYTIPQKFVTPCIESLYTSSQISSKDQKNLFQDVSLVADEVQHSVSCDDKGIQTSQQLSQNTPRKIELEKSRNSLKRRLSEERYQNKILKLQVNSLSEENKRLLEQEQVKIDNEISEALPPKLALLVRNSKKNSNKHRNGHRFDPYIKILSLGISYLSPLTYRFLQPSLDLPSRKTLQRFVEFWPRAPGCSNSTIKFLQMRNRAFTEKQRFVSISCDEMSLKCYLEYESRFDQIVGLEDFGNGDRSATIASSVMVIMVQGLEGRSWTHPLAYYYVHGSCRSEKLVEEVTIPITKLQQINLRPCQFVCDQGKNFVGLSTKLGVSIEHPYFFINNDKICYFFDVPHLIKSTRNCVANEKNVVSFNGGNISWQDIVHFYSIDSTLPVRCAPKLTKAHIFPNTFQKMKVRYATQVLSNTVSSALNALYSSGHIDFKKAPTTPNTSAFISFFDKLFDIFNTRSTTQMSNDLKSYFCGSTTQFNFLCEAESLLKSLKVFDRKVFRVLWETLNGNGFISIGTRLLTQDKLEHFFGEIRRGGSNSPRITPQQFSFLFQKRIGLDFVNLVDEGNCEPSPSLMEIQENSQFDQVLETVASDDLIETLTTNYIEDQPKLKVLPEVVQLDLNMIERQFLKNSGIAYVAGWFYLKSFRSHNCCEPLPYFDPGTYVDDASLFCLEKQFENCNLIKASEPFISYFKALEYLVQQLSSVTPYVCCPNFDQNFFLRLFIRVRIFFILKFTNKDINDSNFKIKYLCISNL